MHGKAAQAQAQQQAAAAAEKSARETAEMATQERLATLRSPGALAPVLREADERIAALQLRADASAWRSQRLGEEIAAHKAGLAAAAAREASKLSDVEREVIRQLGLSESAYLEARTQEVQRG